MSPSVLKKGLDVKQWNTYRVELRGNAVTGFVNGEEIGRNARPANRKDGFVGMIVQAQEVAFRRITVEVR